MLSSISGYSLRQTTFKQNLHPDDIKFKQALIEGVRSKYQFTPKLENLNSIVAPNQLKELLKKLRPQNYAIGKACFAKEATIDDFENITNGTHCINLHIHTNNSDGCISVQNYLGQARKYGDKLAKIRNESNLPYYISSISDHNNVNGVQEAIASIAEEPDMFKNFKFVPGCEFMFLDNESGFEFSAFEVLGYCFNPFDKEIVDKLSQFNPIELIKKLKEFGGILSYAHPIRYCQGNGVNIKFIEYLKRIGINGIESNYQYINFRNDTDLQTAIEEAKNVAKENGFWETGGTDSHCKNIFHYKANKFLDKLI